VVSGGSCVVPPSLVCQAALTGCNGLTLSTPCNCVGGVWSCQLFTGAPDCGAPEEPPPETCPPPDQTFANAPCNAPQLQCGGDPTYCDGTVFYDALQCNWDGSAWRWSILAQTICGDGGPPIEDVFVPDVQVGD
jgi:hypothetical protein